MLLSSFFCPINGVESLDNSLCLLSLIWVVMFHFVTPQRLVINSSLVGLTINNRLNRNLRY
jgi:hypothetical protein